jgi:chemotaxis protein methyltransferase CheR
MPINYYDRNTQRPDGMNLTLTTYELAEPEFQKIRDIVYHLSGIILDKKHELIKARLSKRLRTLGLSDFKEYIEYLEQDSTKSELNIMIDGLTTNKTSFFREPQHFDFLQQRIVPTFKDKKKVRFWSAGCSSGEEPYSLAILLSESIPDIHLKDVQILASDISSTILTKARNAHYDADYINDIPKEIVKKYFVQESNLKTNDYTLRNNIKSLIKFAKLNLMDSWPLKGPFDVIFCRNVMIYYDLPTRKKLVSRFWELLKEGGFFFIGHSESLTSTSTQFKYIQPAVYQK